MSVYDRMYVARIAPITKFHDSAPTRSGPSEHMAEKFERGCFVGQDPAKVPVLLRHQDERVVGRVLQLATHAGWHIATFELDHSIARSAVAADWLRVGSGVSIAFLEQRTRLWAEGGIVEHLQTELVELSVLGPRDESVYPGARIISVLDPGPRRRRARAAAPAEHHDRPHRLLVRPNSGHVIGMGAIDG